MRYLFITIIIISIVSCKNDELKTNISVNAEMSLEETVINFLKWYRDNEEKIHKIRYIKGGLHDTTTFYRIDFTGAEQYFLEL